jgi:molybdopterin-containing oxidoreductase family iron-sulfur binding subunit
MTGRPDTPRFDLSRLRAATDHGSRRFWSSLDELLDEQGFRDLLAAEFPAAAQMFDDPARRQFLKLMGASLMLAGLGGCSPSASEQALPYVDQPENLVPGVPRHYATAVPFEGYAQPVIATCIDGRPIKLDGNPDHPATRGKSDAFMQAAVLGLYDPERSRIPLRHGAPAAWTALSGDLLALRAGWQRDGGRGLRLLTGHVTSPTLIRQIDALRTRFPALRWHGHEPVGARRGDEAIAQAFGRPLARHHRLDACDVIVSLDDDILGPGPRQVLNATQWAGRRGDVAPGSGRVRIHAAESVPGLTGTVASARLSCDPSRIAALVQAFAAAFDMPGWPSPALSDRERRWLDRALADLRRGAGRSLLTIGTHCDPALQAAGFAINQRLGNIGATLWFSEPLGPSSDTTQSIETLAADLAAGAVETLVILDSNPAYTAPVADFGALLKQARTTIHVGSYVDETARHCRWHLPLSHALESWSDARAIDGTATIMQPVIRPLYRSRTAHQMLAMLDGDPDPAPDAAVRATWAERFGADADERWRRALHDGLVAGTRAVPTTVTARDPAPPSPAEAEGPVELVFHPDPSIWDGRFGNIAWLQELPKPLTKVTWGNVIAVSPTMAAAAGLSNGDLVDIGAAGQKVRGACWIVPGQAANTFGLFLGYGRHAGGEFTAGYGYDAYRLWANGRTWIARGRIAAAGGSTTVATTQAHHRMDGFDFVREVTASHPAVPPPKPQASFYPDWNAGDHAWGMVIDLDLCIGCNACIAACNVENNVASVGEDQVARGREMLWLRVDRYYTGSVEDPRTYFQPVPCMHCEKAPCEMGCPVHATVHSPDGINQMVYNRCIGTRTCSSYCPYKVRRFNWYDYRSLDAAEQAAKNPDVTVRSRGVMEKCTYCTQRIQAAQVAADKANRPLGRDEILTACQQACPTQAIVFGDLKDNGSAVARRRASSRHYALLEELGTRPRTTYLARWNDAPDDGGGS